MLYPQSNSYRDVYNLNGIWKFKTINEDYVPINQATDTQLMPVPASYNEIVTDATLRDYVGKVLYEREFSLPVRTGLKYRLRVGAASHKCEIYLNGEKIGAGLSGFLPVDLPLDKLKPTNRLSILIDNRLTFQTFPVGQVRDGIQLTNFDFYNFTGIHRDVLLYTVPEQYIEDIVINTVVDDDYRRIFVEVKGEYAYARYVVKDKTGQIVAESDSGEITIENPVLWSCENPHLYTLIVKTENDEYIEKFGIRKVSVTNKGIYLNDEPVYLKGCGLHEDFTLLGKGNNAAVNLRTFELLKWLGANSFRTSHYPYSEEIMSLADEYGIMVIDELPAAGLACWNDNFTPDRINDTSKALHKELVRQLLARDKNHPCVIMISVANEPGSHEDAARTYFKDVIDYTHTQTKLPITLVEYTPFDEGPKAGDLVDVICLNRYYGWYINPGRLGTTREMMREEMNKWYEKYQRPVLITEFGADTVEGIHSLPSEMFSEEYQTEFIAEACKAFDDCDFCVGEHVWNFADFRTKQGYIRVRGNRKGIFTRERQPKMAAHYLRERWKNK